jgi:hypothetical protein
MIVFVHGGAGRELGESGPSDTERDGRLRCK